MLKEGEAVPALPRKGKPSHGNRDSSLHES